MGFWLKACHKCSGDVYFDVDSYGPYAACLQCGQDIYNFPFYGTNERYKQKGAALPRTPQRRAA